jgi:hypothetical protein
MLISNGLISGAIRTLGCRSAVSPSRSMRARLARAVVASATSAPIACASRPQRLDRSAPSAASSARCAAATDSFRVVRMRSRSRFSKSQLRASLAARSSSERRTPYHVPQTTSSTSVIRPTSTGVGCESAERPSNTAAPVVTTGPSKVLPRVLESRKRSSCLSGVMRAASLPAEPRATAQPPTGPPAHSTRLHGLSRGGGRRHHAHADDTVAEAGLADAGLTGLELVRAGLDPGQS